MERQNISNEIALLGDNIVGKECGESLKKKRLNIKEKRQS